MPVSVFTCTGVHLSVVVPSPSCPLTFPPQAQTVPSFFTKRECENPQATDVIPVSKLTCTGIHLSVLVPSPSSQLPLYPQLRAVLSEQTAREYAYPAAITCAEE